MLAFAAFVPHPLLSIPEIGKDASRKIRRTAKAMRSVALDLYAAKADSLIIITPHSQVSLGAFTINQQPKLEIDFRVFGDLVDQATFTNDTGFGYKIKESVEASMPVILTEEKRLDYGSAVPLWHLLTNGSKQALPITAIGCAELDVHHHYAFGQAVNRQVNAAVGRIAVIASGDLAHVGKGQNDDGHNEKAREFNEGIVAAVTKNDLPTLLKLGDAIDVSVVQCGLKPLITLLGILDRRLYRPDVVNYDFSAGVGYLTTMYHWR